MTQIRINKLEVEWNGDGCVALASGFSGVVLICPRCQEVLPRDVEHRCGDRVAPVKKRMVKGEALLRRRIGQKRGKA